MALSFKDKETDSLAPKVASLTGETVTDAVRGALPWDDSAIDAIIERFNTLPVLDTRSDDEILGYDEFGLLS
jgi:antitoxin VapB